MIAAGLLLGCEHSDLFSSSGFRNNSAEHVNGDDRDSRPSATMQNPYPTALEEECSLCGAGGASAGYVCGRTLIRGSRDMSTYIMDTY